MTNQAKRLKKALKNAGLKDVRVRTEIKRVKGWDGKYHSEYGDARATVYDSLEDMIKAIPAVLASGDVDVTRFIKEDGTESYPHFSEGTGKETIIKF